jgi:hypothetical protein
MAGGTAPGSGAVYNGPPAGGFMPAT